jgi:hypothetical protein
MYVFMAVMLLLAVFTFFGRSSAMADLVQKCGGQTTGPLSGKILVNGREVFLFYMFGGKHRKSRFTIRVDGNFNKDILIRKEESVGRFARDCGLGAQAQPNGLFFDNEFYFECDDQEFARDLMGSQDIRGPLRELLQDFDEFEIFGKFCSVDKKPCEDLASVDPLWVASAARHLIAIVDKVPPAKGN